MKLQENLRKSNENKWLYFFDKFFSISPYISKKASKYSWPGISPDLSTGCSLR